MMQEERRTCICVAALAILLSPAKPSCGQSAARDKKTQDHTQANSQTSTLETEPALDGYCPAAFLLEGKALHGNPAFSSVYIGEKYYFSSKKAKLAFDSNPEKYLPKLGGWCLMALGGPYGNRIIANPEIFEVVDGSVYLFSSQRAKDFYMSTPGGVVEKANKLFGQARLFGYCPVSYITKNKAVQGDPKLLIAYKRAAYRFADASARQMFMEQPARYTPPYEGYCAASLVDKKVFRANPTIFNVYEGKVYFFLNAESKQRFDNNPAAIIKRADIIWKKIQKNKIVRKGEDPNE